MLYPKSKDPQLSAELFQNPTSEYRATPFWAWNCKLEKEELLRQLEIFKKMGMGGAHMHVRTGMTTPYLSDEHMDLVKSCAEKCRQEGMLAWLYDEDRWPSGAAGGIVTKNEAFRGRQLMFTTRPYDGTVNPQTSIHTVPAERNDNGYLAACYDIVLDENGCLAKAKRIGENDPAEGTKWYVYVEVLRPISWFNGQTYVDTMNPKAIQKFIDVTYERYLETVGQEFGGLIPAIFTDEPQFVRKKELGFAQEKRDVILPWTEDVPETYLAAYGEDIWEKLPELLWNLPEGQVSTTRYHYHDHLSQRFTEAFADQCGAWCGDHGLMLTGHVMLEATLESQTTALGEAMRSYRAFQLPGIDMLCNRTEFTTAKQTQSAVRQYGREGMLSEMYGITGWDYDFRGHRFQGDWQAALGVTVRVPHLSYVSMKGEAKRDYPASISYQSPWWQDYGLVEDHFARVATAMTRGKAKVKVAVIHPIESYWLHFGPKEQTAGIRAQMDENFQNLTDWLLHGAIDFDFICESLFADQCQKGSAPLQVGQMAYDTVIVPNCQTLRSTTLERLEAFQNAGGRLIFIGEAPKYADAVPSARGKELFAKSEQLTMGKESILDALEADRLVDIRTTDGLRTDNLVHQLRQDGSDQWLYIAHSRPDFNPDVPACQELVITLKGEYGVMRYDTQTGNIAPMASTLEKGKTVIRTKLWDLQSLLLRFTDRASVPQAEPEEQTAKGTPVSVPQLVDYRLEEPNVLLLDKAEFALDGGAYQPEQELLRADNVMRAQLSWPNRTGKVVQPWAIPEEKIEHTMHLRFTVHCAQAFADIKLATEDAEFAKVTVNGKEISAKVDGWFTDKSIGTIPIGSLQAGENTIELVLPFGKRIGAEWSYLLGDFGVKVMGEYRLLVPMQEKLGFDTVTTQGLAHYGSNITYRIPVTTHGGKLRIHIPHYAGAAVKLQAGEQSATIVYPPYTAELSLPAGEHTLELKLLGNRENCFGPLHIADLTHIRIRPSSYRFQGDSWTESYRLKPLGILSAPILEEI